MGRLIIIALLGLPLAEIAAFVAVGSRIGVLATLALVLLAFMAGVVVLRLQSLATALEVRQALAKEELPARALFDGACRVLAGLLLMLPGFVSDAAAILLLLPPVRDLSFRLIARHVKTHSYVVRGGAAARRGAVIEGEFEEVDPDEADRNPPQLPAHPEDDR